MNEYPILDLYRIARERVLSTRGSWNCITPGCPGDMDVRASTFLPEPEHADDMLKCPTCRATVVHGQLVDDPVIEEQLRREVAHARSRGRGWRRVDFIDDWPDDVDDAHQTIEERLSHLGYL